MKKHAIVTLLIMVLASILVIPSNAANTAIIEIISDNIHLTAGTQNHIKIQLKNTGDYKVFDIEAFLTSTTPGIIVLEDAHKVFSEIAKKKTKTYEPVIYVDQRQPLGAYILSLTIIYNRYGYVQDSTISVPIGIIVDEGYTPRILYSKSNGALNIKTGSDTIVEYTFTNNWEQNLTDIVFTLTSTNTNIMVADGVTTKINNIVPGGSVSISPKLSVLEGTPLNIYMITASTTYRDVEMHRYHQVFSLPVNVDQTEVSRNTIITLDSVQVREKVQPGDLFNIEIKLVTSGAEAYSVISSISFPSTGISPISPTSTNLGDIDTGSSETVSYNLLVDGGVNAGQYPVTVTISYTDARGTQRTHRETITIIVDAFIDFELLEDEPLEVYRGEIAEIEADLLLIGTGSVQFVSIDLVENSIFSPTQGSNEYVGAVDPDSPIPFDLKFKVDEKAESGDYKLGLTIRYRDHLNKVHEELVETMVHLSSDITLNTGAETKKDGIFSWILDLFR